MLSEEWGKGSMEKALKERASQRASGKPPSWGSREYMMSKREEQEELEARKKLREAPAGGQSSDASRRDDANYDIWVRLKATSPTTWAIIGVVIYLLGALAIADATASDYSSDGTFAGAFGVALVALGLFLIAVGLPTLLVVAAVTWALHSYLFGAYAKEKRLPAKEKRRLADESARRAGFVNDRQMRRQIRQAIRLERASRSSGRPARPLAGEKRIRRDSELDLNVESNLRLK